MPLFNGISKVNLNSSITVLDTNMGLSTKVVFSTYRFKGMLYLGTNNGVFYLDEKNKELDLDLNEGRIDQFFYKAARQELDKELLIKGIRFSH